MKRAIKFITLGILGLLSACSDNGNKRFRLILPEESGVTFRNNLHETVEFNIFNYLYFYNGAGVAVGDVNGDGYADIFFTSNQEPEKLYLNQGNFRFRDVTQRAGAAGVDGWTTGVTMADVNGDGKLDIYISCLGDYLIYKGKNLLLINDGNDEDGVPHFTDRSTDYGLDLVGFSTQSAFFDYDLDGDLDMFFLTHSVHDSGTYGRSTLRKESHALAGDRLMRNDGGRFVDVTPSSGIYNSVLGYGLGVVVSDVNVDGWPDIYVGNDFHENDYLYINQGDGTFEEVLEKSMNHTSRYTMGVDFADFNNDAFPDLVTMDMLPEDQRNLKASMAEDPYDVYHFKINFGYNHQFARNTLQVNNRDGTFSDIALMAGVYATDWSWSSLFADFDLDGRKDLFVSNGIFRRSNDLDYINFISVDSVQNKMRSTLDDDDLRYIEKMPQVKISNYLFINNGDSTFSNKAPQWGLDQQSYSQGAAYGDLDNDGDLDLVVNNIEDEAFIYENLFIDDRNRKAETSNFGLTISLEGESGNTYGIGTKVFLYDGGQLQMQECSPTRGYQSSVDPRLVFGTARQSEIDSLIVIWPGGAFQKLTNVKSDSAYSLYKKQASGSFDYSRFHQRRKLFIKTTSDLSIDYVHKENSFVEFNREALIPHMMSSEGPAVAVGDINNDGNDDLFLGGSKRSRAKMFLQSVDGSFHAIPQPDIFLDSIYEDVDAVFFDADQDSDADLFVVSGGNEYAGKSRYQQPRLYLNNGEGIFFRSQTVDDIYQTGSCVSVADFDSDGDNDIFVGSRTTPWHHGRKPDSFLFRNDGSGKFSDVTDEVAPGLLKFGFVKAARWADIDNDKDSDLIVAAEWSPLTIFENQKGKLAILKLERTGLMESSGWWNTVETVDYDSDGDLDLVAGNQGVNSKLKASLQYPVRMYVGDFDKNNSTDQLLTHYAGGKEYLVHTRDELTKQLPLLKKQYLSYHKFAQAEFRDVFDDDKLGSAKTFEAHTFESAIFENMGGFKFKMKALPSAAQISPVRAMLLDDFDGDGETDLLIAGNFYPVNIQLGRYDASNGLLLKGDGKGAFNPVPCAESGFSVDGETRYLRKIIVRGKRHYLAVRNNDSAESFTLNK